MRKGMSSSPGDYIHFKSQIPLHKISIGTKQWRYYDFGPKDVPPLVCIPGIAGTADVYYKQIMFLTMRGYRVVSIDIPQVWNHQEWIHSFEKFLDAINVHHVHLYGTSLGGFLAQLFAQYRPRRVKSLVLSNSFLETYKFSAAMPWSPIIGWTPSFLLKRYILTGIPDGPHEPFIADSIDFVVGQIETLSREDLSSRLTLNATVGTVGPLLLLDTSITIMDTNDFCAVPQQLKDQLAERYPSATQAILKSGGDFPFLSRPDEVNLYLQLHLRRIGVEANIVSAISDSGGAGSSSSNWRSPTKRFDDPPSENGGLGGNINDNEAGPSQSENSNPTKEKDHSTQTHSHGNITDPTWFLSSNAEAKEHVLLLLHCFTKSQIVLFTQFVHWIAMQSIQANVNGLHARVDVRPVDAFVC